ncbi:fused MFS/spermidine synthase [Maritalea mobilis]|uniref:fused MFS/spermidine synthase n=1 Tax=Maritalea mobilis TaxID=483324 RepID=UPI001C980F41|nr:fused MFS/spermidine synthase [Maritalea mobilis]MBY6200382.1 fused MFS/spermidine synthase [Maritalea mobilis]
MTRATPLWLLVLLQGGISAASLVVEIVAGRMLAPHVGMSLYTWTSVIAVVLAGFSAGHWWGGRLAERPAASALAWTGGALLAGAVTTAGAVLILPAVAGPVLAALQDPVSGITALTMAAFFLPSFFAGVPAPVLAQIAVTTASRSGPALGAMFASGAVGAIAGTLLAGFFFISWLGSAATLLVVTIVYVLSGLLFFWLARSRGLPIALIAGAAAAGLGGLALAAPDPCDVESRYFCIRVDDLSANPERPVHLMVIDHLAHGISARDLPEVQFTEHAAMLAELSERRAPRPNFTSYHIGGGTYSVPRAFAAGEAGEITVAEIDPAVTEFAEREFWFDPGSATILHEDARRALLTRPERHYDVIIGDAFTDVVVPVHLVTQEFFQLAADRLNPGGSYLMNVIDYEDRLYALSSIVATMQTVFPVVEVWTHLTQPAPGARMVFVVVGGDSPTAVGDFSVPAPDLMRFGALADGMVAQLAEARGQVLTDDYAPIDRLIGRPD